MIWGIYLFMFQINCKIGFIERQRGSTQAGVSISNHRRIPTLRLHRPFEGSSHQDQGLTEKSNGNRCGLSFIGDL